MAKWIERLDLDTAMQMLAALPFFAVIVDRERYWLWVNRIDPTLTLDDLRGTRVEDFVAESYHELVRTTIERSFASGEIGYYEALAYGEGAMQTWYGVTIVPFVVPEGGEQLAMLLSADVTTVHHTRQELAHSEERLRTVLEQSPDQIAIIGTDLRIHYSNKPPTSSASAPEGPCGATIPGLTHPDYRDEAVATIERVLAGGPQASYQAFGPDGDSRRYEVRVQPFPPANGEPRVLLVTRDITDSYNAEALREQLLQAQKMELMGQLAGGVAHDFNNLLTVIVNNAAIARSKVPSCERTVQHLDEIARASQRAADLTRQLLAFSRKQPRRATTIAAGELVTGALGMVARVLPETIVVHPPAAEVDAALHVDRGQIEQVIMNLCVNARDAMPDGGALSVHVRTVRLDARNPRAGVAGAGDYLEIGVTDTGTGMAPKVAARIFEPFFTTKAIDKGTGLGMSVALGIVEAHGGTIDVDSQPGRGTTVRVFLPVAPDARAASAVTEPLEPERPTTCRVLIVDDDARVRHSLRLLLEHERYSVVEAASGEEAIEVVRNDETIDVALLDVVMPDLGGPETYERLLELRPDLPVAFSTGYGHTTLSNEFLRLHGAEVIPKPYRLTTLAAAIERARRRRDARRRA